MYDYITGFGSINSIWQMVAHGATEFVNQLKSIPLQTTPHKKPQGVVESLFALMVAPHYRIGVEHVGMMKRSKDENDDFHAISARNYLFSLYFCVVLICECHA